MSHCVPKLESISYVKAATLSITFGHALATTQKNYIIWMLQTLGCCCLQLRFTSNSNRVCIGCSTEVVKSGGQYAEAAI